VLGKRSGNLSLGVEIPSHLIFPNEANLFAKPFVRKHLKKMLRVWAIVFPNEANEDSDRSLDLGSTAFEPGKNEPNPSMPGRRVIPVDLD
jgi:hypothetical protein